MGLFDTIRLEAGITLPEFPADLDPQSLDWQTKDLGHPALETYKLTAGGRLLRQTATRRPKTSDEKQREAAAHGFETWDAYVSAVETADQATKLAQGYPMVVQRQVEDEVWWADHNQHGTFEFHATSPDASEYDIVWSYKARFTKGTLDEFVFLGDRHGPGPVDLNL